jgi:tetratricopeptide (TPR) repeat protein
MMGIDILGRYFEESLSSENGQFILAWSDASPDGMSMGARDCGDGQFVLLSGGKIIAKGSLQRPNDGKVANQGSFIINDWMFGESNKGTFYAFGPQGKVLVSHRLRANLGANAISADGRYAVCQALYSDNEDGNTLSFFDLDGGKVVWKIEPVPGPADAFRFDLENSVLHLLYDDGGDYRYDFEGRFLDSGQWEKKSADSANGYELFDLATDKIDELEHKEATLSSYDDALSLLKKAIDKGISDYYSARAHRILGEVLLKRGQRAEALEHFEKALAADPKIGLKKLLAKLKSEGQ